MGKLDGIHGENPGWNSWGKSWDGAHGEKSWDGIHGENLGMEFMGEILAWRGKSWDGVDGENSGTEFRGKILGWNSWGNS